MRNRKHSSDSYLNTGRSQRTASRSSRAPAGTTDIANAKLSYERFMALGRAAALTGDTIEAESFYQHAEHYLRLTRQQGA